MELRYQPFVGRYVQSAQSEVWMEHADDREIALIQNFANSNGREDCFVGGTRTALQAQASRRLEPSTELSQGQQRPGAARAEHITVKDQ